MDITGEGDRAITTWDGLVHWGTTGMVCSGGEALGKMTGGLVTGFRSKDVTCGVSKEG